MKAFYQLDHHKDWLKEKSEGEWYDKNLVQWCRLIYEENLRRMNKDGDPYMHRNGRVVRLKVTC